MKALISMTTAMASKANIRNWPMPSPMPMECASQAKPKPAANPPSMPPQRLRCGAGWGAATGAGAGRGATLPAPCEGALGAASRWVTWLDCLPTERPPPKRAASAFIPTTSNVAANNKDQLFICITPKVLRKFALALDSNMQCRNAARQVVEVHMAETPFVHHGFEFFLARVHAN